MKKILNMIALLVAMTNTTTAQNTAQPANMTIYDREGNLTDLYEFKYDAKGNQIEETDFSSDELAGSIKRYYTYNSEGKIQYVVAHKMGNGTLTERTSIHIILTAHWLASVPINGATALGFPIQKQNLNIPSWDIRNTAMTGQALSGK